MKYDDTVLTILQHNCNRSTSVMQGLMESGEGADIIAIQEPWIGKTGKGKGKKKNVVCIGEGQITVGNRNFDIVYRQVNETARTMWMIRKDKGLRYTTREDLWDDKDVGVLDVKYGNEKVRIINVYNQRENGGGGSEWCMERFPKGISRGQPTIAVGDFNAKGGSWDLREEEPRGKLVMWVAEEEE